MLKRTQKNRPPVFEEKGLPLVWAEDLFCGEINRNLALYHYTDKRYKDKTRFCRTGEDTGPYRSVGVLL